MQHLPRPLRTLLPVGIILITIAVFVYFFARHPQILHALGNTQPWTLVLIAVLYCLFLLCLIGVYDVTLRMCGKPLAAKENFLLTAYSTIVNFFGPLQSGPGVRAAYLKQRHKIKLRDYTLATLIYYGFYAVISALFLFVGSQLWWLAVPAAVVAGGISYLVIRLAFNRGRRKVGGISLRLTPRLLGLLFFATFCQLAVQVVIYFVELHAVHNPASLRQAITYGGAANFALFVSLTPGAIGFREAFLEFSRQLHHISTASILAASVIDRAVYVVFLGLLFLMVLSLHARQRLSPKSIEQGEPEN